MSEPILRRSSRNAAKKDVPAPPAQVTKKRASVEPKKPVAKKVKTTVDKAAAAVKAVVASTAEAASSSKTAAAPEKAEKIEKPTKTSTKLAAKPVAKPTTAKPVAKPSPKTAKTKKADEASEGLKDGDFLPKDLPAVQTQDGSKTTINDLLETTQKGIIIFAYPKGTYLRTVFSFDTFYSYQFPTVICQKRYNSPIY